MKGKRIRILDETVVAFMLAAIALSAAGCATIDMKLKPVTVIGKMDKRPALSIGSITVDKASGGRSIEREIRRILPSLLVDRGFAVADAGTEACPIDVLVIEREFLSGTSSVRSLMLEVSVFPPNAGENTRPDIIARKSVEGNATAASSGDLYEMLAMAIDALAKKGFAEAPKDKDGGAASATGRARK